MAVSEEEVLRMPSRGSALSLASGLTWTQSSMRSNPGGHMVQRECRKQVRRMAQVGFSSALFPAKCICFFPPPPMQFLTQVSASDLLASKPSRAFLNF